MRVDVLIFRIDVASFSMEVAALEPRLILKELYRGTSPIRKRPSY